jgi:hypothetical protein
MWSGRVLDGRAILPPMLGTCPVCRQRQYIYARQGSPYPVRGPKDCAMMAHHTSIPAYEMKPEQWRRLHGDWICQLCGKVEGHCKGEGAEPLDFIEVEG